MLAFVIPVGTSVENGTEEIIGTTEEQTTGIT